jgi:glucose-6-phosphate isomerase
MLIKAKKNQAALASTLLGAFIASRDECKEIEAAAQVMREMALIFVIGIGGSSLGAKALIQALAPQRLLATGRRDDHPQIVFLESVEPAAMQAWQRQIALLSAKAQRIAMVVISKSGTTIETMANASAVYSTLYQYVGEKVWQDTIIISDEGSGLWQLGSRARYRFAIPREVGGRFSVFTSVGLVPCALAGIDPTQLIVAAADADIDGAAWDYAVYNAAGYHLGKRELVLWLSQQRLHGIGLWYRQLIGESLGKRYTQSGHELYTGLTPTIACATDDLHSLLQLYLATPRQRITTFLRSDEVSEETVLGSTAYARLAALERQSISSIQSKMFQALERVYGECQAPYAAYMLGQVDTAALARFMSFSLQATVYMGQMLAIDPFGQPEISLYKRAAARELAE